MKKYYHILLGVLSCCCLALGFARAAGQIDPLSLTIGEVNGSEVANPATNCTMPCDID